MDLVGRRFEGVLGPGHVLDGARGEICWCAWVAGAVRVGLRGVGKRRERNEWIVYDWWEERNTKKNMCLRSMRFDGVQHSGDGRMILIMASVCCYAIYDTNKSRLTILKSRFRPPCSRIIRKDRGQHPSSEDGSALRALCVTILYYFIRRVLA